MRRTVILLLATIFCGLTVSYAQTQQQQVVVKTRSRFTTKRTECQPVVQAIVTPKGASSGVYSDSRGCARFGVPATDGYYISSVYKENYELFDKSWALFTEHHYSKEPLVIYMDNKDELREYEYVTAQRYRTMYDAEIKRLKAHIDSLERNGLATQQELQALKAEYYRNLEEVEKIVTDATKRYLLINFDKLEEEDIKFYELFNSGNIKAAKAFLKSPSEIERMTRDANITSAALDNMYGDIDRHCMGWCEVYSSEFKRDSVAYMLELRAAANRKNVDWQLEAASYVLDFLGDYDRALNIYEPTLEYCKEHYGELHEKTATLYNNLGVVYDNKGQYDNALVYYKKAQEIWEKVLAPQHPDLAVTYNNIGLVYHSKGEYDNALAHYNKAREIEEKVLDPQHPDLAVIYNNIGLAYDNKGQYDNALAYYNRAREIREKVLDPLNPDPDLATTYNNIGGAYDSKGQYDNALEYLNKAREIREKVLDPLHPSLATTYNNIGSVHDSMGQYDDALEYHNKALEILEKVLDPLHPNLASLYNNIGLVYDNKGEYDNALEYYNKAREIREKVLDQQHPDLAKTYNNIGLVYGEKGEYDNALEYYKKAKEIYEKILPNDSLDLAGLYFFMAVSYVQTQDLNNALIYLEKSLVGFEKHDKAFAEKIKSIIEQLKARVQQE